MKFDSPANETDKTESSPFEIQATKHDRASPRNFIIMSCLQLKKVLSLATSVTPFQRYDYSPSISTMGFWTWILSEEDAAAAAEAKQRNETRLPS